jgi:hypothetical protein
MNHRPTRRLVGRARLHPSLNRPAALLLLLIMLVGCARDRQPDWRDEVAITTTTRADAIANLDQIDAIARRHVPDRPVDWAERVATCRTQIKQADQLGDTRRLMEELVASVRDPHFQYLALAPSCRADPSQASVLIDGDTNLSSDVAVFSSSIDVIAERLAALPDEERLRARAVIIDLRGSDGGQLTVAAGIVGFFVEVDTKLGEIVDGDTRIDLVARKRAGAAFKGKIAVVVDRRTISAAEVLATSLQRFANARVFGESTAGAASPSTVIRLKNGDWLQHPVGRFEPADVAPVKPDDLATGEDAMTRAREWVGNVE